MQTTPTIKLYDKEPYTTNFTARVLSCEEDTQKDGSLYKVILDQTLFFPEEGGQSPDCGTIQGIEVCDVQIKDNIITHTLTSPVTVGETVSGELNWEHRFHNMQQHSGEHIFSGTVHKLFGFNNVGFHLSDQIVTMDFDGVLTTEDIQKVEYIVNEAISQNVEIQVSYPTHEELAVLDYRSKIEIEGQVRIVTIPGYDVCACCAPHVRRTGEIGLLKVMTVQNYKGGVRISILCGFRALMAFREKLSILNDLSTLLTCGQDLLVDNVKKQKAANQTLKSQLATARQTLMEQELSNIPSTQKDVILFYKDIDTTVMRNAVNSLTNTHTGVCAIFNGDDENGYNYIIGSSSVDCKALAQTLKDKLNARGGGSNVMIQGSVNATAADITSIL